MNTSTLPVETARSGIRMSADERRRAVLEAAMVEFAITGFAATSTEDIAKRAGISQPYLFRLFGTKKDLFIAVVTQVYRRIGDAFRDAASGLRGAEALAAIGGRYKELLQERELLLLQLHGFAAASDSDVQAACRQGFRELWAVVADLSGYPQETLAPFFAQGMLINVMAAMEADELDEEWARSSCEPDPEVFREMFGDVDPA